MLASIMGPIGGGGGYAVYMFFVSNDDTGGKFKTGIFRMCWAVAMFICILYFFVVIFIKAKPPIPPTKSASYEASEPVCKSLKELITNKNFVFVAQAFGLIYACLTTFSQEVALIIKPYGFETVILSIDHRVIPLHLAYVLLLVDLLVLLSLVQSLPKQRNIDWLALLYV